MLNAYYFQDEREAYLLRSNLHEAEKSTENALEEMAAAFEVEFPHLERNSARRAGKAFMRGLFVQDEIENWGIIKNMSNSEISEVLYSDLSENYDFVSSNDPRWDIVKSNLREVCKYTGIDEEYAGRQARFWLLHGQLKEYWEKEALRAHELKLRAMIDDPPEDVADKLGQYFVAGVKLHDRWGHLDKDSDISDILDIVSKYYQKIFDLRIG
ncbi:hypothetical protein AKJ51_00505 [candidate division MSBL1 archaeon SCGC-AAA382A20]|uniref:Uncharacterized protein n=1 Tax=candidate division MSBL1 archaeon SCGC-AAA382A20 TaxID=1698280 RepID=A0A133VMJ7_9EURY|nr:hypothetical protein AKJ51_00505 [candidate division MSBL1 archaeon SCGC-AAA382A20]